MFCASHGDVPEGMMVGETSRYLARTMSRRSGQEICSEAFSIVAQGTRVSC